MKKLIIILLQIVVIAGSASAQKVKVWADPSVDLAKYKTYAWDKPIGIANPLMGATIMASVDQALVMKGLRKVETDPELTISILTSTDSDLYVAYPGTSTNVGTGMPRGVAGTQSWPITKGTLMVGITDAQTKSSVWRATATQTLETGPSGSTGYDAKLVEKPIRKAVGKMFKRFPTPK